MSNEMNHPNLIKGKTFQLPPSEFLKRVEMEVNAARVSHAPINSAHEGYSVILEELDEFWEEVRKKRGERDLYKMYMELVQIAAMAMRTAEDVVIRKSNTITS